MTKQNVNNQSRKKLEEIENKTPNFSSQDRERTISKQESVNFIDIILCDARDKEIENEVFTHLILSYEDLAELMNQMSDRILFRHDLKSKSEIVIDTALGLIIVLVDRYCPNYNISKNLRWITLTKENIDDTKRNT